MCNIRTLKANEIECRAAQVSGKSGKVWVSLLLYKDARVDMRILDEVFGMENWQRTHEIIEGRLYCTVEIYNEKRGCWIKKQDVGTESNTEKEKGQASDAFKRACFNVGIGRELYTAPTIFIYLNEGEWSSQIDERTKKEKFYCKTSFSVAEIGYDNDRNINRLVIVDKKGNVRYQFGTPRNIQQEQPAPVQQPVQAPAAPAAPGKKNFPDDTTLPLWQKTVERMAKGEEDMVEKLKEHYHITNAQIHALRSMVVDYKINNNLK